MEKLRTSNLKPGDRFENNLFSVTGQKLLAAGMTLTARHISAISRGGDVEVFAADTVDELVEAGILDRYDQSGLKVGQKAQRGLLSRNGQVIVEAGDAIEAHHLDALRESGGGFMSKSDVAQQRRERILMCDAIYDNLLKQAGSLEMRIHQDSNNWFEHANLNDWPDPDNLQKLRADDVNKLRLMYAQIEAGVTVPITRIDSVVDALMDRLVHFPTRIAQLALLCPRQEDYLPDHAYTTTILAMSIGANLRWSKGDVRRIAQAGLLYDLGMLLVPQRIRVGGMDLTDVDRARVHRHPVFTLSLLECVCVVEPIIKLAAAQHHERENGSGYPRSLREARLCDLARVLAVADTYAAITEPRSYRSTRTPYMAIEETLREAASMTLWKPAVRALVQATGVFPVGSYVKLSDDRIAHVLASNADALDRPIIQPLDAEGQAMGQPIDLSLDKGKKLTIVRPLASAVG
ncbi:MAG: HD domain-containing protein [Phycisphaera sp.]|nr:HD domain-containing protein [Phycisphaera sp.]